MRSWRWCGEKGVVETDITTMIRDNAGALLDVDAAEDRPSDADGTWAAALALARRLGVARVEVKDESRRLGLPSFKILGGSRAVHRLLMQHVGRDPSSTTWADLLDVAAAAGPLTLATATDGNHGRGVARIACLLGYDAVVYVPQGTAPVRIGAIAGEGPRCRSTRQL